MHVVGTEELSNGVIAAIVLGSIAGSILVCCWASSLYNCCHHVHKYWCTCCHKKDYNDFHVTTVLANPAADPSTRIIAARLPPSYSSIFEPETEATFRNDSAFSRDVTPSTSLGSSLQAQSHLPLNDTLLDNLGYISAMKHSSPKLSLYRNRNQSGMFPPQVCHYNGNLTPSTSMGSRISQDNGFIRNHSMDSSSLHSNITTSTSMGSSLQSSPRHRPQRNNSYDAPCHVLPEPYDQKLLQMRTRQKVLEALSYHHSTSSFSITSDSQRSPKRKPKPAIEIHDIDEDTDTAELPAYHFRRHPTDGRIREGSQHECGIRERPQCESGITGRDQNECRIREGVQHECRHNNNNLPPQVVDSFAHLSSVAVQVDLNIPPHYDSSSSIRWC